MVDGVSRTCYTKENNNVLVQAFKETMFLLFFEICEFIQEVP